MNRYPIQRITDISKTISFNYKLLITKNKQLITPFYFLQLPILTFTNNNNYKPNDKQTKLL